MSGNISLNPDQAAMNETLEKANRLVELLQEASKIINSFNRMPYIADLIRIETRGVTERSHAKHKRAISPIQDWPADKRKMVDTFLDEQSFTYRDIVERLKILGMTTTEVDVFRYMHRTRRDIL